ncbi:MAG TPA: EamA family transporter RarD [Propionibacteriaceae bacterium]|nr:EamA family transporter RarD [Propionibacteriaceae bacterium]
MSFRAVTAEVNDRNVGGGTEVTPSATATGGEGRSRYGIGYGLAAYSLWGLVPLFWPLVNRSGAVELLAHRVLWSLVLAVVLLIITVPKGWWSRLRTRRSLTLLTVAAATVSVNWGVYIWSVNSGHVLETALGYYINPIFSILVGVLLLRERLAAVQWVSVGLAAAAVVVLTIDYGQLPWIALVLAASFATYGVMKKQLNAGAVETLTVESAILTPPALAYLGYLQFTGALTFGHLGWGYSLLLTTTGVVTIVPLLFFAASATRLPLSTLGLLQYLAPTFQFLLGVLYFHESMSVGRWVGFSLVWLALMILTGYGLVRAKAARRPKPQPAAPEPI